MDLCVEVDDADHELGFAGAIQAGWDMALEAGAEWIFHLEADFTFNRPVPLDAIRELLAARPYLLQVALVRQAWNERERRAGGVLAADPDNFTPRDGWIEHCKFFTTNPSLYPASTARRGWPQVNQSEGIFALTAFASDPALRSAYWGDGSEWVTHIGQRRPGSHGY